MSELAPKQRSEESMKQTLRLIDETIARSGLFDDVKNCWNTLGTLRSYVDHLSQREMIPAILPTVLREPFQSYGEYMSSHQPDAELLSYILEHSNPDKVARFDELVDRANGIRSSILEPNHTVSTSDSRSDSQMSESKSVGIIDPDAEDPQIGMLRDLLEVQREAMLLIDGKIS